MKIIYKELELNEIEFHKFNLCDFINYFKLDIIEFDIVAIKNIYSSQVKVLKGKTPTYFSEEIFLEYVKFSFETNFDNFYNSQVENI